MKIRDSTIGKLMVIVFTTGSVFLYAYWTIVLYGINADEAIEYMILWIVVLVAIFLYLFVGRGIRQ